MPGVISAAQILEIQIAQVKKIDYEASPPGR